MSIVAAFLFVGASSFAHRTYAASPLITINANYATCCHGDLQFIVQLQNASAPFDQIHVQGLAPDSTVVYDKTFAVSSASAVAQDGFMVDRKYIDGSYTVVATYQGQTVNQSVPPYSTFEPQPPTFVALSVTSSMITGRVQGGIEGEQVSASVYSPSGALVKTYSGPTNLLNIFEFGISDSDRAAFTETGTYRVVLTHVPTGVTADATFSYTSPNSAPPAGEGNGTATSSTQNATGASGSTQQSSPAGSLASAPVRGSSGSTSIASVQTGSNFSATGQITSLVVPKVATSATGNLSNSPPAYLLAGKWAMKSIDGNITSFSANLTMVRTDGLDRHVHQLANFRPQNTSGTIVFDKNGTAGVSGKLDIYLNGKPEWSNVSATVSFSHFNTVKIVLNSTNPAVANHFGRQPIYGVTGSFVLEGKPLNLSRES
ncbi:MAG: hypothetical protein ABI361_11485 [Nitrososphaera sp.]